MNLKNEINIACATDDGFVYPLAVMIVSVLENHKNQTVNIHLFSALLSEKYIVEIEKLVKKYNQSFFFYRLENSEFEGLPTSNRISYATYYRLLMPKFINSNVSKFLYLDADIIVVKDLSPLFEINMGDKLFGAIDDIVAIDCKLYNKHSIPEEYLYFNAGVLFIDKLKWEAMQASTLVMNYIKKNHELCSFHDQDGLNAALFKYRYKLEPIWNQQIGLFYIEKDLLNKVFAQGFEIAINSPVIVHFNGMEKPWQQGSAHPYKKEFKKYAKLIETIKYNEPFNIKKRIKKILIYGIFGWIETNRKNYLKTRIQA